MTSGSASEATVAVPTAGVVADGSLALLTRAIDRREPVASQVYDALREAIVSTRLRPGTPISENSLCRQFDVSRTPVRAAIQRLSEEGLVEVFPQQGSFVSRIRLDSLQDSHFIRRTLEVGMMREAAARWQPSMGETLRSVIAAQQAAVDSDDLEAFIAEDERFHFHFAIFSGRTGAWPVVTDAKAQLTRIIRLSVTPGRLVDVIREHLAITAALEAGDVARAEAELVCHINFIFALVDAMPEAERKRFFP